MDCELVLKASSLTLADCAGNRLALGDRQHPSALHNCIHNVLVVRAPEPGSHRGGGGNLTATNQVTNATTDT